MTSALPPSAPPPVPDQPWGTPPPPPPAGPVPRPALRRSRSDKVIGGVAGGLAEYTGVDALLWRVGAIALTLAGGSGLVIYLLLWLLMPAGAPAQPGDPTAVERVRTGPRSAVPGVTVAALLIVIGLGVLLTQFTDLDLGARGFLGTALLIVGVGLVVGAVTGAGRGAKGVLIGLGVVLTAALAAVTSIDLPNGAVGDRTYRPATASAVEGVYEHAAGDLTIDLRDVDLTDLDSPIVTRIDHGIGDVDVLVPRSADVRVTSDTGIGETELFGDSADSGTFPGLGAPWSGDDRLEFRITIDSGAGDVEVSRG
ncbi:Phage shock protein C, PspC [Modestobacter italicus]|uniref:Phage shock protein C, PspC n=1 Tax=Modestobacter italicus (strain DSM 44449 / CECT 9708 / BC 501) TaxID=2732864 RepID=I4F3L7_MODI5|nr:PspC domain-containing protein [Modestobacter marinus]CCH90230.1 Phage shock protein C, PspC [Modestobacter marinus]